MTTERECERRRCGKVQRPSPPVAVLHRALASCESSCCAPSLRRLLPQPTTTVAPLRRQGRRSRRDPLRQVPAVSLRLGYAFPTDEYGVKDARSVDLSYELPDLGDFSVAVMAGRHVC